MNDNFDLTKLTEFNHALIYAFEPEASPQAEQGSTKLCDMLYPPMKQFTDTFSAYLFAQEDILPLLRRDGLQALSHAQWLDIINNIHLRIGKHLLANLRFESGKYAETCVFRWHPGCALEIDLEDYLSGVVSPMPSLPDFCQYLENKYERPALDFQNLINIIRKTYQDSSIVLTRDQQNVMSTRRSATTTVSIGMVMATKLHVAYHMGKLTDEEKRHVNKIVKLSTPASKIPAAMDALVEHLMADLQTLDTKNLDLVSEFISKTFYEFTDVHPFPNANGRTGTCLINIILRSLGYPSILLRHPGENEDPTSLYSRAIASIDDSRDLLVQLIKHRISDAIIQPYADEPLKSVIKYRVVLSELCQHINADFPDFDLDTHWENMMKNVPSYIGMITDENQQALMCIQWGIGEFSKLETTLIMRKQTNTHPFNQPAFTAPQQNAIRLKLQEVSGVEDGWKAYQKGSVFLLENSDPALVGKITELLNQSTVCKASALRRPDTGIHVVKVEKIDIEALLALTMRMGEVERNECGLSV